MEQWNEEDHVNYQDSDNGDEKESGDYEHHARMNGNSANKFFRIFGCI